LSASMIIFFFSLSLASLSIMIPFPQYIVLKRFVWADDGQVLFPSGRLKNWMIAIYPEIGEGNRKIGYRLLKWLHPQ